MFSLIMQVHFACNVILMQINNFDCCSCILHHGKHVEVSQGYSRVSEFLNVNPSCLGQFANIFKIYARVFELADNIHYFNGENCFLHDGM